MGGDRKGIDVESSHTAGRRHLVRSAWGYPCQVGGARLGESTLGYPVSDQADTSDGKARLSRFQKGRLEWDKATRRIDVDINIEDGLDLAHQKEERHHLQRIQVEKFADTPSVVDELTSRERFCATLFLLRTLLGMGRLFSPMALNSWMRFGLATLATRRITPLLAERRRSGRYHHPSPAGSPMARPAADGLLPVPQPVGCGSGRPVCVAASLGVCFPG